VGNSSKPSAGLTSSSLILIEPSKPNSDEASISLVGLVGVELLSAKPKRALVIKIVFSIASFT
jgi:hypothetical protein